jgi:GT2 family glycosyltransferase
MSAGLVSAIVPTYNRAYCVTRAIDSVLAQTYGNVEVVVIDDGSTDATADVIRERYGSDLRVRYFYQANGGVSAARNTGLRQARGEFIALIDSDDYWHPWKLQAQIAALRQFPDVGLVWTEFEAVDPSGRVFDPRHLKTMYAGYRHFSEFELFTSRYSMRTIAPELKEVEGALFYAGNVFTQMLVGGLAPTSTSVFRRERIEKVGYFDTTMRIGEDYNFLLRTAREGTVGYIDAPSMQYAKGLADHLTLPENTQNKLAGALSHLQTITQFVERDRALIQLTDRQIRRLLADVHRWIGEKAALCDDRALARKHFRNSLRLNWHGRRSLKLLLMSYLPATLGGKLRKTYRTCQSHFRSARSASQPA